MDRSLDEIIAERPPSNRGQARNRPRRSNAPRNGVKKVLLLFLSHPSRIVKADKLPACSSSSQAIGDWVHDKFEDDRNTPSYRGSRARRLDRYSPEPEQPQTGAKLRVTNLHYDLTEDDLEDLFTRIGPINALSLRYDRAGRSEGVAFVTYKRLVDAQTAIREFDGANAKGQPITLTMMSSTSGRPAGRNPFDFAEKPKGSLFDRTEKPHTRDSRSLSPEASENVDDTSGRVGGRGRRSDVSKPAPEHIDRYVPGQRSPRRRGDGGRGRGRRLGEVKDRQERNGSAAGSGRRAGNRRAKKTQEELDQEMEDYWGNTTAANGNGNGAAAPAATSFSAAPASTALHDDIDMIE
ncbi:RNA binding domain-containing protein [Blastomyces dermatitidis ER-3]|uniref:RNA binding domain-containing protein n=1 Tax=Ajellomyces dermatitidis (strain ER-3 / ATCC MYA-2586) TaxID=559297 RepID=A0ABP2F1T5_AJEDR|nr:RNA binding domain-containing protein [Blastomyces dermatitidis ER-3]EEQ88821.1 RNA binding domain-containing protein [Blastomyces dermatitidis ER-3]